ncbi:MAG: right-handed parallel beta-helix repeat-containing protein, partial [Bacteroidales bacterium]|nr:right-handed parallel beta-helix repeat-containing protein [Bacteroidales bacterium]
SDGTEQKIALPALQIGCIVSGDTLPDVADETFVYDLPLSFETSEELILFTNYETESGSAPLKTDSLEWSILRGKKGQEAGSVSLYQEEDDWNGFETVTSSPYFTLQKITDPESAYDQMMMLSPAETAPVFDTSDSYDYYIRAAYYPQTEDGKAETFLAAATIPFIPKDIVVTDTDLPAEDPAESEETPADPTPEDSSVSENAVDTVSGNTSEDNSEDSDNTDSSDSDAVDPSVEDADFENTETEPDEDPLAAETLSTLSENSAAALSDETEQPPVVTLETAWEGTIALYQISVTNTETQETQEILLDGKNPITIQSGGDIRITAKTKTGSDPETPQKDIVWDSSDETVASVTKGENGAATITTSAEGIAKITASYRGVTASVIVDVVTELIEGQPDNSKLLDLSGDIRVAGFEKENPALVYTGQKVTQDLRVYHNNTLLKEKTDYTLTYKNNINAAVWNSAKAPNVTITLKGQYQGSVTLFYTIYPLNINKIDIFNPATDADGNVIEKSPGYEQTVNYAKNLNIPAPVLTFGKKKLANKKDFTCDYTTPENETEKMPDEYKKGDSYEAGKVYSYAVKGTGNFTGEFFMKLVVLNDKTKNFASASVKLDQKQYEYAGKPLTKENVKITEVKLGGQILDSSLYDYEVSANGIQGAYLTLSPSENGRAAGYRGCKNVTLKLVGDRQIKDAASGTGWKDGFVFSQKTVDKYGGIFQGKTDLLQYNAGSEDAPQWEKLVEGTDYTIKYSNAKKVGNVTVTFTGTGRYKGSLKLKYAITPNIDKVRIFPGKNVSGSAGDYKVTYQKGGAAPELILKDAEDSVLKVKTDYTIQYKNNKAAGSTMSCIIKGKGSYKGYEQTVPLTVTPCDIATAGITLSAPDKVYNKNPNKWKSAVTVTDTNGKKLAAGTDYLKEITYTSASVDLTDASVVPPVGTSITITITGTGNYTGTLTKADAYRIYDKTKDIGKLKIVIDPQEYTGEEITLTKEPKTEADIHVYANNADYKRNQELPNAASCYEIVSYKNNIKPGTAKVTLHGIGEYGGTKTYSFKIQKKKYRINRVKTIKLNKTSLSFVLAEADSDSDKLTLSATLTAESYEKIANTTVIWTSSNSNVVSITENPSSASGWGTVTKTVTLTLHKEGDATITAIAQDGNKKAQCKVTVVDAPLLREAGQTIKENIGQTYELHMDFTASQNPENVKWSSNNDAVSVTKTDTGARLTMKKAGAAEITAVYTSASKRTYKQTCYAAAIDPDEKEPEGNLLVYRQAPGTTDDTPYINKMLRDWEWGNRSQYDAMYLPPGVYHIDAAGGGKDFLGNGRFGGIILTDDQKLIMSSSTLLVAIGNNKSNSQVIWAFGRKNVTISGGQIIGERKIHKGSSGEWGHGILISGCKNVTIENVEISQCWGDGIYLGFYDGPNTSSSGVTITNCNLHDNRRNNLSITDASNVTVTNCQFNRAKGTAPQYGIDIEPNSGRTCSNVTISNSTFQGNAGGTIQILGQLNAHVKGVKITNCKGDSAPVQWSGFGGSVSNVSGAKNGENSNNWGWKQ